MAIMKGRFDDVLGLKELELSKDDLLVDSDGVRYKKIEPVVTLECKMTSHDVHITPESCRLYYGQQILDLQKEGKLKKGWFAINAYLVAQRRNTDEKEFVQRSWGPTEYTYVEILTTEFYFLGEKKS